MSRIPAQDERRGTDPEPADTRSRMIEEAESLFGRRGIEAVSLREIAAAAGQRNNSAVAYHFGDKNGLVEALMDDRMARAEHLRQRAVASSGDLATLDAEALLGMLWQPLLDIDARKSGHRFIHFLLAYQFQSAGARHPFITDPASYPVSSAILNALRSLFPHLAQDRFYYRLTVLAMMFWSAVSWHDREIAEGNQTWSTRFSVGEIVGLAIAALEAAD